MSEGTQEPASSVKSDITSSTEGAQTPQVAGGSSGPGARRNRHRIIKRQRRWPVLVPNQHPGRESGAKARDDHEKKVTGVLKAKSDPNDSTASSGAKPNSDGSAASWQETMELAKRELERTRRAKTRSSRSYKLWPATKPSSASGVHAPSAPTERPSGDAAPTEASLPSEPSDGSFQKRKSYTE